MKKSYRKYKIFYLSKSNSYTIIATKYINTSDNLGHIYSGEAEKIICVSGDKYSDPPLKEES